MAPPPNSKTKKLSEDLSKMGLEIRRSFEDGFRNYKNDLVIRRLISKFEDGFRESKIVFLIRESVLKFVEKVGKFEYRSKVGFEILRNSKMGFKIIISIW